MYENSPEVYTSKTLATLTNVSSRTIKNDLEMIRNILCDYKLSIHSERGKGYWINEQDKERINNEFKYELFNEVSIEDTEIIEYLLFRKKHIPVYEVAERFYYSESTLLKKITQINQELELQDLQIIKEPGKGIKLVGNEKSQRMMYSQILKKQNIVGDGLYNISDDSMLKKVETIQNVWLEFQRKHEIGLSDIARTGLIIDVVVTLDRIQRNENIEMSDDEIDDLKNDKEWYYAVDLAGMLEGAFNIPFTKSEIGYLSIHLLSANLTNDKLPDTFSEIREQINEGLLEHIIAWVNKLDQKFNTKLEMDIDFISSLALHIKPLLKRIKFKMNLVNPWVKSLKEEHQKAYEMAIILAQDIQKEFNKPITENEVAYLAMHIGGALEKERAVEQIQTVIICASGIGTSNFLKARLKKIYPQLKVVDILPYFSTEMKNIESELIISTIPIDVNNQSIVQVSPLLTEQDQEKIELYLSGTRLDSLETYFKEELFITNFKADNKIDVIKHSSQVLFDKGYVEDNYYASVLEREAMSSTEVGNLVVIPHAFSGTIKKQGICVTILDKPILWENHLAQIVFTLALDTNMGGDFTTVFERITELRDNLESINKMLQIKSFEEFENILNRG